MRFRKLLLDLSNGYWDLSNGYWDLGNGYLKVKPLRSTSAEPDLNISPGVNGNLCGSSLSSTISFVSKYEKSLSSNNYIFFINVIRKKIKNQKIKNKNNVYINFMTKKIKKNRNN